MIGKLLPFLVGILSLGIGSAQRPVTPLFADEDVLTITLVAPFGELVRRMGDDDRERYQGTMALGESETHNVTFFARGNFRRDRKNCSFPPIRLRIDDKPEKGSLFHKQRSLKLVTHCRDRDTYRDYVLAEYTAYKLYNLMTPASFRVRLLNISYVEESSGEVFAEQIGFFIEDIDDLADRQSQEEVEVPLVSRSALRPDHTARLSVFAYMIGNVDWSVLRSREGDACCHNMKLIGADEESRDRLTPVPYDFDHSGIVNASYAEPPSHLGVQRITDRVFRGFCALETQTLAAIEETRALEDVLLAEPARTPGLSPRKRARIERYLSQYFRDIRDERAVQRNLLSECR